MSILSDTDLIKVNYKKGKDENVATIIIEPLMPGYGLTLGHALRRILLSSLSGAAITSVKINDVSHEFSTIKGVKEDVVDIILNLKNIRFKMHSDEPVTIKLSKKGPGQVKAGDFDKNSSIEIINKDQLIANLDKSGKIICEAIVKKGTGYEPVEKRKDEKLPHGTIAVDSIFTPVKKIHYNVENTRVGGMTNYDKIILDITTDGSITPEKAFYTANKILIEHFEKISNGEKEDKPKKEKSQKEDKIEKEKPKTKKMNKKSIKK